MNSQNKSVYMYFSKKHFWFLSGRADGRTGGRADGQADGRAGGPTSTDRRADVCGRAGRRLQVGMWASGPMSARLRAGELAADVYGRAGGRLSTGRRRAAAVVAASGEKAETCAKATPTRFLKRAPYLTGGRADGQVDGRASGSTSTDRGGRRLRAGGPTSTRADGPTGGRSDERVGGWANGRRADGRADGKLSAEFNFGRVREQNRAGLVCEHFHGPQI